MIEEGKQFPDITVADEAGAARPFKGAVAGRRLLVILAPDGGESFISRVSARLDEIRARGAEPVVVCLERPLRFTEAPLFPVFTLPDPWAAGKELGTETGMVRMMSLVVTDEDGTVRKCYREPLDRMPSLTTLIGWLSFLDRPGM
jgi:hypothetical protein